MVGARDKRGDGIAPLLMEDPSIQQAVDHLVRVLYGAIRREVEQEQQRRREQSVPAGPVPGPLTQDGPVLLTVRETAERLHLGTTVTWRLIHDGTIPSVRLSPRIVRVPLVLLEERLRQGGPLWYHATNENEDTR